MDFYMAQMMPVAMIIIALAIGLICTLAIVTVVRRRRSQRLRSAALYVEALKELIRGDEESAFRHLRSVVMEDTANVDAYLKLGDILRRRGETDTALKIHRQLTVRKDISPQVRKEVLQSLAMDYMESGKNERAIATLKELISSDRRDLWSHRQLLRLYQMEQSWSQALAVQETIFKITGQRDSALLALFEVQIGHQLLAQKEYHKARLKYKDALRRDRTCLPAYLALGDAHQKEHRLDQAIESWKELIEKVPQKAYLAFNRLEKSLFEKGQFGEVSVLYHDLLERDPENLQAHLALASFYEKKGDLKGAIQACENALQIDPNCGPARQLLIKYHQQEGNHSKVMEHLMALAKSATVSTQRFACRECGYESPEPLWRCPQCGQWRTFNL